MKILIVDASVAAKWFLREAQHEIASELRRAADNDDLKLLVPEVFYLEMGSIFRKKVKEGLLKPQDALETFARLEEISMDRYSDKELAEVSLEIALKYEISVYDAAYVGLASACGAPLVTADEVLLKKCRKHGFEYIRALRDL